MLSKSMKSRRSKKPKDSPNTEQPSAETRGSQDDNMTQLLGVTIAAINVTKDLVPIDLAKGILGTVVNILMIAESVIKNKSDFLAIVNKCKTIREILERMTKDTTGDNLPEYLARALFELNLSVNNINNEVVSRKEQGLLKRFFSATIDRDQVASWEKDIDRVLVLFNIETIAGIAMRVERLVLGHNGNTTSVNVLKYRSTEPPSRPSMFYGRDNLVAELTTLIVNDEHIALIGPGGIGKSSLAKAILHEPRIIEKFADRRFFVTYDGLYPSTITFETFLTQFARDLGIELAGADPEHQISGFLRSATALVILDNAETFEEASALSALEKIPLVITRIAHIPGVILILTSRSSRNAPNIRWITKDIPPLDLSSAQDFFFQIYQHSSRSEAEDINDLLKELDFHPLSINLLANAAQHNKWSPVILLKRWNNQRSKVLETGKGKLQSLSDTMQLSLNSPSVHDLGEDGHRILAVIAFLPQGLNGDLAGNLLPSLPQVDNICDVLCTQSLIYRQDNFLKVLAPIRHYIRDSLRPPDSTCLQEIRAFYYHTVDCCSEERDHYADIVISDHLNIEHVIAFNLAHVEDGIQETYGICWQFLLSLGSYRPRPTTLTPAISNIKENSSTWMPKAHCLLTLAHLYRALSQHVEAIQAFQAAEALYLTAGDPESMGHCLITRADLLRAQGRFIQSQNLLEDLQHSKSWRSLSETTKARAWVFLDLPRMYTFTVSADELFVKPSEDQDWDLQSRVWHCRAKFYHGGDGVQVNAHLKELLLQCNSTGDPFMNSRDILEGLAETAFCEGRLSDAMDNLHEIVKMFEGRYWHDVLWYTVLKAIVASKQGHHALAKELIRPVPGPLEIFAVHGASIFLHRSYGSACIELSAGAYDRAESHFIATIEGCDIQGHLDFKAYSKRGLGEIAFVRGDFALAAQCFMEIRSLCAEMGVPLQHLYSCEPFYVLPDRFEGWTLFLESRSPFANIV